MKAVSPSPRSDQVERVLDALAWTSKPPQVADGQRILEHAPITREVLERARRMGDDLGRVSKASASLPVGRCDFLMQCLEPWLRQLRHAQSGQKDALRGMNRAASLTALDTGQRQRADELAFEKFFRMSGAFALLNATSGLIRFAHIVTSLTRIVILGSLAIILTFLDQALGLGLFGSVVLAIIVFVGLDLLLVDRLLEPWLERRRFRALLAATEKAIDACRGNKVRPDQLAALFGEVIEGQE